MQARDSRDLENVIQMPPACLEAEVNILGGIMLDPSGYDRVKEILEASDFYLSAHREIYSAIARSANKGNPTDFNFVREELGEKFKAIGGMNKLVMLLENTVSAVNIDALAKLVKQKSVLRALIAIANETAISAMSFGVDPKDVIEEIQGKLMGLQVGASHHIRPFGDVLVETLAEIEALNAGEEASHDAIPTGFYDIDSLIGGFRLGCLTVIGARGGLGKTTMAIEFALNAAMSGIPTAFFALEMTSIQTAKKAIARLAAPAINSEQLFQRNGIKDNDWEPLHSAIAVGSDLPLMVQDASSLTISSLRSDLRRTRAIYGDVGLVIVDYVQLLSLDNNKPSQNRVGELDSILKELRAVAKDFNCAVVGLAQLNREVEKRGDKRPIKSDFRESGAFEQEAAVMLGLYRDDYFNPESQDKGIVEVSILKNRFGKEGVAKLLFDDTCGQFKNFANH